MKRVSLEDLIDPEANLAFPVTLDEFKIKETPPPAAIANLKTMRKLGILTPDGIMALLAQAPIDPINLAGTLMQMLPDGWAFSPVDFSMFRVLSRSKKKEVAAALRIDLIQGDTLEALARNKAGQLTIFRSLTFTPGVDQSPQLASLCQDAIEAALREDG